MAQILSTASCTKGQKQILSVCVAKTHEQQCNKLAQVKPGKYIVCIQANLMQK